MKFVKVLSLLLAAAGVLFSASCCNKAPEAQPPVYVEPTK